MREIKRDGLSCLRDRDITAATPDLRRFFTIPPESQNIFTCHRKENAHIHKTHKNTECYAAVIHSYKREQISYCIRLQGKHFTTYAAESTDRNVYSLAAVATPTSFPDPRTWGDIGGDSEGVNNGHIIRVPS